MNEIQHEIERLQEWYISCCDGDWEHEFGIHIGTLDNPGWSVSVDLERTKLMNAQFEPIREDISESDWLHCWVANAKFEGRGDPSKLARILIVFLDWRRQH